MIQDSACVTAGMMDTVKFVESLFPRPDSMTGLQLGLETEQKGKDKIGIDRHFRQPQKKKKVPLRRPQRKLVRLSGAFITFTAQKYYQTTTGLVEIPTEILAQPVGALSRVGV